MQVSSAFNAIAGPRLYHTLTLGETSGLANPFGRTKRGVFDIPVKKAWMKKSKDKQKTQGKERDLGLIQHVFVEGYFDPSKLPKFIEPADKVRLFNSVKSVRLKLDRDPNDPLGIRRVEILERFSRIEKLVLAGSSWSSAATLQGHSSTCRKRVILINRQLRIYPPSHYASGPGRPLGPTHRIETDVYVFTDKWSLSPPGGLDPALDSWVRKTTVLESDYGKLSHTIIVVNPPKSIRYEGRAQQCLEDCFMQMVASRKRERAALNVHIGQPSLNDVPMEGPTFKFISMTEYLRDYDWTGEFTDEEARSWLDEEEAERAAA